MQIVMGSIRSLYITVAQSCVTPPCPAPCIFRQRVTHNCAVLDSNAKGLAYCIPTSLFVQLNDFCTCIYNIRYVTVTVYSGVPSYIYISSHNNLTSDDHFLHCNFEKYTCIQI